MRAAERQDRRVVGMVGKCIAGNPEAKPVREIKIN